MFVLKITVCFLLALTVGAEKKIELQDIEEDNLKSEKEKEIDSEPRSQSGQSSGLIPLEFLKNGFLRYFEPASTAQPRYVHQYAVTEQPERPPPPPPPVASPKSQYTAPVAQQAMVGYLSNVPMQIYLVPQYYNDQQEHTANAQSAVHYTSASAPQASYPTAPEAGHSQSNYIEVPAYVAPTAKTYIPQYSSPVALVGYTPQATVAPQPTIAPVLAYPVPVVQYQTAPVVAPTSPTKEYYQNTHYTDTNVVDEVHEQVDESPSHTDASYHKGPVQEYTRFYPSRTPLRNEYRHSSISELPHPNPLILKSPPSHLSHIPKALPIYRPLPKPAYASSAVAPAFTPRPADPYGPFFKRRPTSLLDSYIPSHIQVEYMKRGFAKDPLEAYEALSSGRHLVHSSVIPRHYERGFLPNQMYETASGGITYGHYKRAPKIDKVQRK